MSIIEKIYTEDLGSAMVLGILIFFGIIETLTGLWRSEKRKYVDWIQEVGGFFILTGLVKPVIVTIVIILGNFLFPQMSTVLMDKNFFLVLVSYVLIDDCMQYWYHRSAHEYSFLWKLHRAHHQAEEMGYFVSYRNALLYYIWMPNIWWIAFVTSIGGGMAVAIGLILKQAIIISSHSTVKWDSIFYKNPILRPVIQILERIIITPAFHHAHHGVSQIDGISNPNGNYGNMFSIWDQLFGSATFVRAYPVEYGLHGINRDGWVAPYLYPLIESKDEKSELNKNYRKMDTTINKPAPMELEKGKTYSFCACGMSKNQPFCDGTHHGTKHKPNIYVAERTGSVKICQCTKSGVLPFCDGSHKEQAK